jgi:hypothetical protein
LLYHFSFNARDPETVAEALAKLLDGRALKAPSPPFPSKSFFVCLGDEHGTLIEVMPWGETRDAARPNGVGHDPEMRQSSGAHILVGTELSSGQAIEQAGRLGWRAELASAGLFKFVKVWVENSFLVELLPPEHRGDYRAAFGSAGIDDLDNKLRQIEQEIRRGAG